MKYTLTILLACLLMGGNAQTNPTASEINSAINKKSTVIVVEGGSRRSTGRDLGCIIDVIKPNICEDCDCRRVVIKKELAPPVDMMVRQYFGISYWN